LIPSIAASAVVTDGISVAAAKVDVADLEQLKDLGDALRSALKESGVGLLATVIDDKVQLVCVVTDDLIKSKPAGKLVGIVAKQLGGGGGGKPHLATAGGKDVAKLDATLSSFPETVASFTA
jgi:alanyl-tRNA synthetase